MTAEPLRRDLPRLDELMTYGAKRLRLFSYCFLAGPPRRIGNVETGAAALGPGLNCSFGIGLGSFLYKAGVDTSASSPARAKGLGLIEQEFAALRKFKQAEKE